MLFISRFLKETEASLRASLMDIYRVEFAFSCKKKNTKEMQKKRPRNKKSMATFLLLLSNAMLAIVIQASTKGKANILILDRDNNSLGIPICITTVVSFTVVLAEIIVEKMRRILAMAQNSAILDLATITPRFICFIY